jgi:hypothetical protein
VASTATAVRVVHDSVCPDIGPICDVRAEPPQVHDQRFYVSELRPIFEYGITDFISAELQVPLRLSKTTITYRTIDGQRYIPDYQPIHHRNQTLVGIGDPWLSARFGSSKGPFQFTARAGVTLPLGKTQPNPFALGRAGLVHEHIQFGTGTFDPVIGASVAYLLRGVSLQASGQAKLSLYQNGSDFQAGNIFNLGIEAQRQIVSHLRGGLSIDAISERPERWQGTIEQDGNLGRTDVLVGISAAHPIGEFALTVGVKVPVYQKIAASPDHDGGHDSGQLTYPAIVNIALARRIDLR